MTEHQQLIDSLGGREAVVAELARRGIETNAEAVRKWAVNGVPFKFRPVVAEIARRKRVAIPANFLRPAA